MNVPFREDEFSPVPDIPALVAQVWRLKRDHYGM